MFGRVVTVAFVLGFASTAGACKEDDEATTQPAARTDDRSVPASEESKKELGVEKWFAEPGDPGRWWVAGLGADDAVVVDAVVIVDTTDPEHGSLTFDVHGKITAHVGFYWTGNDMRSNADDLGEAEQSAAIHLFDRMSADLEAGERNASTPQLTTQSVSTSLAPQGGHVGGELVRRQQDIIRPGECLMDPNGSPCRLIVLKTAWALVKTGMCIRNPLNCVTGPMKIVQVAKEADEKQCKYRPCPAGWP